MGMVVQHNISAQNANEAMRKNVAGLKKQTEKLSTGYNINRAADNAAGLAISEKMRSQIRGLTQASANSNDAISLIQTAEGGLQETEDILQRMRELSVQSANGTYTDEDRMQIQHEVDALKGEVDRISSATEYNTMKLLDGSLAGAGSSNGEYGAKYGVICDGISDDEFKLIKGDTEIGAVADAVKAVAFATANVTDDEKTALKTKLGITDDEATAAGADATKQKNLIIEKLANLGSSGIEDLKSFQYHKTASATTTFGAEDATDQHFDKAAEVFEKYGNSSNGFHGAVVTSNVQGASINVTTNATKGGEGAAWDKDGKTLTLNLVDGKTYTQDDIDKLIEGADTKKADGVVADISLKLKDGVYTAKAGETTAKTAAGVRAESVTISLLSSKATGDTDVDTAMKTINADNTTSGSAAAAAKELQELDDPTDKEAANAIAKTLGYSDWEAVKSADEKNIADTLKTLSQDDIADIKTKFGTAGGTATEITAFETNVKTLDTAVENADPAVSNPRFDVSAGVLSAATTGYGDQIKFTSNSYGVDTRSFEIATDAKAGAESVEPTIDDSTGNKDGKYTIHLSTGVEYSNADIEKLMAKAGLDYTVEISDSEKPDGDVKMKLDVAVSQKDATQATMAKGEGVGKEEVAATGTGLTFQIGANGVEDQRLTVNIEDMSARALGVANVSVAKQDDANDAINKIDKALTAVSSQRAKLGAVQNRLEHTVNSLNTANENLSSAESQIRDTDMAQEMIKYTKSNILQQASQSMLAQANQQPQGVLQLLG